jgi:hypothetical protein
VLGWSGMGLGEAWVRWKGGPLWEVVDDEFWAAGIWTDVVGGGR